MTLLCSNRHVGSIVGTPAAGSTIAIESEMMAALCGAGSSKDQIETGPTFPFFFFSFYFADLRQRIAHLEAENEQLLATLRTLENPEEQKVFQQFYKFSNPK